MNPPIAKRVPHTRVVHGVTLEDPYAWLEDKHYPEVSDPEILAYLQAENDYFQAWMKPHKKLVDTLFEEMKARQKEDDASVPFREGDFYYQWHYESGAQYPIWCRWPLTGSEKDRQVILNEPELASNSRFFRLGGFDVSPNGRFLAWSSDTDGSERFTIHIRDLTADDPAELLDEPITGSIGNPIWANDNQTFYYRLVNDAWRPYQVKAHRLGDPISLDSVVYEEQDESFFVSIGKSQSEKYLFVNTGDHVTSEVYFVPAATPRAPLTIVTPRRSGHEYQVDHREDAFFILTNDEVQNFRLVRTPENLPAEDYWQEVVRGDTHHYLLGFIPFKNQLVIKERLDGLAQIRIQSYPRDPEPLADIIEEHFIQFPEAAYDVSLGVNAEYDPSQLRLTYESMVTPVTVYDYDFTRRELLVRKVQEIPSGYDSCQYHTERLLAPARDGANVPVSIVYPKGFQKDGNQPLYLYAYGAYGHAVPPSFSPQRLSLLDRGFAFAIAHVRGGDDLGYRWYQDGKLGKRNNTFNDFVDVARFLIHAGYTGAQRLAIAGGSAGGELMGAVVNQAPELWGAVAAHVPFVDVLNTMLNETLPLTPIEWPEWGNPLKDKEAFEWIRSYSPYDNLKPGDYPPMLITAGINDPRVTYWEPAKYVARLRTLKTDDNPLLLKTNMDAGHGGKSGRFDSLYEVAEEYAFMLSQLRSEVAPGHAACGDG